MIVLLIGYLLFLLSTHLISGLRWLQSISLCHMYFAYRVKLINMVMNCIWFWI